jgi:hypothetical protein
MRNMLLPCAGLLAIFSIASANNAIALTLSDDQLDSVFAGASVASGAYARATGPETFVSTEADTTAEASETGEFAAGLGVAAAFGNGRGATATADTGVHTNGSGSAYNRNYNVYYENRYGAYAVSAAVGATR